jgi:uracil phosphoribosyltransferase
MEFSFGRGDGNRQCNSPVTTQAPPRVCLDQSPIGRILKSSPSNLAILNRHFSRAIKSQGEGSGESISTTLAGGAAAAEQAASKKVNIVAHPLAEAALTALRDKSTPPDKFRVMSNLLLMLLTVEATRNMPTREKIVDSVEGSRVGRTIGQPMLFVSMHRSGLGLVHNIVEHIPNLLAGSISMERSGDAGGVEPRLHLSAAPSLDKASVMLFQPVVASGRSAVVALDLLRRSGAKEPILLSYLTSFQGLTRIHSSFPEVQIWSAAVDTEWNSARGPMPGLGNLSERLFG